jgi:hypothetical protein
VKPGDGPKKKSIKRGTIRKDFLVAEIKTISFCKGIYNEIQMPLCEKDFGHDKEGMLKHAETCCNGAGIDIYKLVTNLTKENTRKTRSKKNNDISK